MCTTVIKFIIFNYKAWWSYYISGYMYAQGMTESILGLATAMAGLAGICGAFLFTRVRKQVGLERTGQIAVILGVSCLSLVVVSVWAPGSPFDLNYKDKTQNPDCTLTSLIITTQSPILVEPPGGNVTYHANLTQVSSKRHIRDLSRYTFLRNGVFNFMENTIYNQQVPRDLPLKKVKRSVMINDTAMSTGAAPYDCPEKNFIQPSIILFLVGIVSFRVGRYIVFVSNLWRKCACQSES